MRRRFLLSVGLILLLAALACSAAAATQAFSVSIQSPTEGTLLPVDMPSTISLQATDPAGPGVVFIELYVDGDLRWTSDEEPSPRGTLNTEVQWTPETEGEHSLMAIAYRADGAASPPATVGVTVVGLTPLEGSTGEEPEGTDEVPTEEPTVEASAEPAGEPPPGAAAPVDATAGVQARVDTGATVRGGPGPFCMEIGGIVSGETITVYELSQDGYWYKTDYLGDDQIGWVWIDLVTVTGDASLIPQGNVPGCIGCGDEICNGSETCDSCPGDCGECCGNGTCQAEYGEDCGTCEADCGACCGNGTCEADREESCFTCEDDCGDCCGDDHCDPVYGEDPATCPDDCEAEDECEVALVAPVGTMANGLQTFFWTDVPGADSYRLRIYGQFDAVSAEGVISVPATSMTLNVSQASIGAGYAGGNEFYVQLDVIRDGVRWCVTGNRVTRSP